MIADKLTGLIITRLNQKFETHYVPLDSAYPTSGMTFIRVAPAELFITLGELHVDIDTSITITCSTRIRDNPRQREYESHKRIVNFAEQVYFWLLTYDTANSEIHDLFPRSSVTNRITSKFLDLRAVEVYADFYDAKEVHERQPAGFKIEQSIMLPRLRLPFVCGQLDPDYFDFPEEET
jgi:hypothetical protein